MYDFDTVYDRKCSNSVKHAFHGDHGYSEDVIPMWVADMDFKSPPVVAEHVRRAAEHGFFGYAGEKKEYFEALHNWYLPRHNWDIKKEWITRTPGVICGVAAAVRALTKKGDAMIIMQPVYPAFAGVAAANERKLVKHQLIIGEDRRFHVDFELLEQQIVEEDVKLMVLCSPHNPGGRVWTLDELKKFAEICLKHDLNLIADEIHHDLVYPGEKHTVFATVDPEMQQRCVICTAPSKTFNLAGLQTSNIIIPNAEMRDRFQKELGELFVGANNMISIECCRVAYESGASWLDELMDYVKGNLELVESFLAEKLPEVRMVRPQGTYMVWLDMTSLKMDHEKLQQFLIHEAKVWLLDGSGYGDDKEGWVRMTIGCPRSIVQEALERIEKAIHKA